MNDTYYNTLQVLNVLGIIGWTVIIVAGIAFTVSVIREMKKGEL